MIVTGNSYAEEKLVVIESEAKEDNRKHAAIVAEEVATMISRVMWCVVWCDQLISRNTFM